MKKVTRGGPLPSCRLPESTGGALSNKTSWVLAFDGLFGAACGARDSLQLPSFLTFAFLDLACFFLEGFFCGLLALSMSFLRPALGCCVESFPEFLHDFFVELFVFSVDMVGVLLVSGGRAKGEFCVVALSFVSEAIFFVSSASMVLQ